MNNTKVLITGISEIDKFSILKELIKQDDNLTIIPSFTSDMYHENNNANENYIYYMKTEDINLAFKNNALLYIYTKDYISTGVTFDDFYNNDLLETNLINFNNIPDRYFSEYDILIVWLDTSKTKASLSEMQEINYLEERIKNCKYLYFLDETEEYIVDTILEYLNDEEKREEILEENC